MVVWVKSTEFYTNPDNSFFPLAVFFNSYNDPNVYPNIPAGLALGSWHSVDLKPHGVSADAKYAVLGGVLLITGGADFTIAVRAPGSTQVPNGTYYQQQVLSPFSTGGERSVGFDIVPLVNGVFEIFLTGTKYPNDGMPITVGTIPCVGLNLKVKGWGL